MIAHVLVVDGEPIAGELTRAVLQGRAHRVDVAASAAEALDLLRERDFDVAILDYDRPALDAFGLARRLLARPPRDGRRPVLMAATGARDRRAVEREAGALFAQVLPKPIPPGALLDAVAAALHERVSERDDLGAAAAASRDGEDATAAATAASRAFWRAHGLARRPRALVHPAPTPAQAAALRLCFDLADGEGADLVALLDPSAIGDLWPEAGEGAALLPIVDVNGGRHPAFDAAFAVSDRKSWAEAVTTLVAYADRRRRLAGAPAGLGDRLLAYAFVRDRPIAAAALVALRFASRERTEAAVDALLERGLLAVPDWAADRSGLTLTAEGIARIAADPGAAAAAGDGGPERFASPAERASLQALRRLVGEGVGAMAGRPAGEAALPDRERGDFARVGPAGLSALEDGPGGGEAAGDRAPAEVRTLSRGRVLLAEPSEFSRDVLRSVLEARSFAVEAVADGASLLKSYRGRECDLLVVSLSLPDMDGMSTPGRVAKARRGAPPPPLLAIAPASGASEEDARRAGFAGLLPRSVRPADLVAAVEEALARSLAERPVQDRAALDELSGLLGAEAVDKLADKLRRRLRAAFPDGADRAGLGAEAGEIASAAGALGFWRLAAACERLAADAAGPGPVDGALAAVRAARGEVLAIPAREDGPAASLLRTVEPPGLELAPPTRPTVVK